MRMIDYAKAATIRAMETATAGRANDACDGAMREILSPDFTPDDRFKRMAASYDKRMAGYACS